MGKDIDQSDIPEVRDVMLKRRCQVAELKAIINDIKSLLMCDEPGKVELCQSYLTALVSANDKEAVIVHEIRDLANKHSLDARDVDDQDHEMNKSIQNLLVTAGEWINDVHSSEELDTTIHSPEMSDQASGVTFRHVTRNYEEIAEQRAQVITGQKGVIDTLQAQMLDLQKQMKSLAHNKDEISILKATIVKQQEEADSQKDYFQKKIVTLQNATATGDLGTSTPRPSMDGRRSDEFGDVSRVGMNQDDLLAISHVMQRTNTDMVKSILQDNRDQQERFFTTMQSPKVELKKFNGDITKYQAFINRFDDIIGNMETSYSVKLNTLLQYCNDEVLKHLSCCEYQLPQDGYHAARKILREKYGKPHLVVNAWLEKLVNYQKLKKVDVMQHFVSDLKACKRTLETMGCLGELDNTDKKRIIVSKLPSYIQIRWRKLVRKCNDQDRTASLQQLIDMIAESADEQSDPLYGADSLAKIAEMYEGRSKSTSEPKRRVFATTTSDQGVRKDGSSTGFSGKPGKPSTRESCVCCDKDHFTRRCEIFKAMDSKTKLRLAREKKMCLLCLSTKHDVDKCAFTWRCQKLPCTGKHNNVFHDALMQEGKGDKIPAERTVAKPGKAACMEEDGETDDDVCSSSLPTMNINGMNHYAMPLSPVYIQGSRGEIATYAFHDTGGGFSVITKKARDRAGIPTFKKMRFDASTLFSDTELDVEIVSFCIRGKGMTDSHIIFNAVVLDQEILDDRFARVLKKMNKWPHLKELNMPLHDMDGIDILLGQDNAHVMTRENEVNCGVPYSPYAILTPLGWTVHGYCMDDSKMTLFETRNVLPKFKVVSDESEGGHNELLIAAVDRMNSLEQSPEAVLLSPEDKAIVEMWDKKTRLVDGHVEVPIPFIGGKLQLPNNYSGAEKRFRSLERRLDKDANLLQMYSKAMHENFDAEYAEKADDNAKPGHEWFVPTQPVFSDKKPGKCRIVGDAGFVFAGACLNESVSPGPNYTAHVLDILLKFRRYKFVVIGDIKAMYSQVKVPKEQRSCLKFLWLKDDKPGNEITLHQMTTHMFGGRWSAAAAIYALRWVAQHFADEYRLETIETILRHFYVDDLLRSFLCEYIGAQTMGEVLHLLSRASFRLTKIASNSDVIMAAIPEADRAKGMDVVSLELDSGPTEQTLGCVWSRVRDTLSFGSVTKAVIYTRRGVLSTMSSLFDPLGLVAPFVLLARILLQDICRLGYTWDEMLSDDLRIRWDRWVQELQAVVKFTVPRWLGFSGDDMIYQVHHFMDASELGYGCASFLCIKDQQGEVKDVNLIAAKSKVTPIKVITIPRLELCAAVLAVKQGKVIENYLEEKLLPSVYWSDSTIVLYYVNGKPWQYRTFVANRVVYLQEHTACDQWRHIDTERNIADVASRGASGSELCGMKEWLKGPGFLMDVNLWPQPFHLDVESDVIQSLEMKKISRMNYQVAQVLNPVSADLCKLFLSHYSRWTSMIRGLCYLRRSIAFLKKSSKLYKDLPLSVEEVRSAEERILVLVQSIYITQAQRKSRIFEKLFPFHKGHLTRVGGRLTNASLTFDEKHPIVFPICQAQQMYIFHVHERAGHAGIDRTFYESRKKYWILGGKKSVKFVVDRCVVCKRTRGKFQKQVMAPLPVFRVEEGKVPFQNVGVDFFGPYYVKYGRALIKRYACMYTDLLMRACHVEIVPDLTSSAFLNSLQRFISRRGKPALLVSDNGTNFVGANREMKEAVKSWNKKSLGKFMAEEGIKWIFNTPTASHHGGAWERMIRIFRNLAMVVIKDQPLTEDSLRTFACVIEGIMNSRPLTKLTEDPSDPLPLTPEHLLNLRAVQGITGDFSKGEILRQKWGQIQYLGDQFWKRWVDEYLRSLQKRDKWTKAKKNVKVGDVVLILDQSMPRTKWPLGLVIEVVLGRDNMVRSVRMRTEKGEMVRPITKIIELECA